MSYKILRVDRQNHALIDEHGHQARRSSEIPESHDYFFLRIESLAESYERAGWEILSLAFPSETIACLFMKRL